jgi:hypothetical protein
MNGSRRLDRHPFGILFKEPINQPQGLVEVAAALVFLAIRAIAAPVDMRTTPAKTYISFRSDVLIACLMPAGLPGDSAASAIASGMLEIATTKIAATEICIISPRTNNLLSASRDADYGDLNFR